MQGLETEQQEQWQGVVYSLKIQDGNGGQCRCCSWDPLTRGCDSRWIPLADLPGRQLGQLFKLLLHVLLQLAGPQQDLADGANGGLAVKQCCCLLLTW